MNCGSFNGYFRLRCERPSSHFLVKMSVPHVTVFELNSQFAHATSREKVRCPLDNKRCDALAKLLTNAHECFQFEGTNVQVLVVIERVATFQRRLVDDVKRSISILNKTARRFKRNLSNHAPDRQVKI